MKYKTFLLLISILLLFAGTLWCQAIGDTIASKNVVALNRIAEEYDGYKWIFGIVASTLVLLIPLGLWVLLKTKAEEWVLAKIAKEAELKVEHVKSAVREFAKITELKTKKILVVSAADGQQGNIKKVFDGCEFAYDEKSWVNVNNVSSLVLGKVDALLFNDQVDLPLTTDQIEAIIRRFGTNVGYFYFGDKIIDSKKYRQEYKIDLDFCNSATRLETGLLSLLKIR